LISLQAANGQTSNPPARRGRALAGRRAIDIALLLSPEEARSENSLAFSGCRDDLEARTGRSVDMINLREVNTVFQNEIITEGRLIYRADEARTDAFEMKVLSSYQKLNEERGGIIKEIETTGRIFQ
jgi:hypothetical protein